MPASQRDLDIDAALFGQFNGGAIGLVFGAALDEDVGAPARALDLEFAIAKEKRRARAAFEQGVARLREVAHGVEHVDLGVEFFSRRLVDDGAVQDAHGGLLFS